MSGMPLVMVDDNDERNAAGDVDEIDERHAAGDEDDDGERSFVYEDDVLWRRPHSQIHQSMLREPCV